MCIHLNIYFDLTWIGQLNAYVSPATNSRCFADLVSTIEFLATFRYTPLTASPNMLCPRHLYLPPYSTDALVMIKAFVSTINVPSWLDTGSRLGYKFINTMKSLDAFNFCGLANFSSVWFLCIHYTSFKEKNKLIHQYYLVPCYSWRWVSSNIACQFRCLTFQDHDLTCFVFRNVWFDSKDVANYGESMSVSSPDLALVRSNIWFYCLAEDQTRASIVTVCNSPILFFSKWPIIEIPFSC